MYCSIRKLELFYETYALKCIERPTGIFVERWEEDGKMRTGNIIKDLRTFGLRYPGNFHVRGSTTLQGQTQGGS